MVAQQVISIMFWWKRSQSVIYNDHIGELFLKEYNEILRENQDLRSYSI